MFLSVYYKKHVINSQDTGLLEHKLQISPYFVDTKHSNYFQGKTGTAGSTSIYSKLKAKYRPKYISTISKTMKGLFLLATLFFLVNLFIAHRRREP